MALKAIPMQNMEGTLAFMNALLSSDEIKVPTADAEAVLSAKSLVRGILQGGLVVHEVIADEPEPEDPTKLPIREPAAPEETE